MMVEETQSKKTSTAAKPRKRFLGSKSAVPSKTTSPPTFIASQIPDEILSDSLLNQAISHLPSNYSFEVHKTVYHVRKNEAKTVALQMPEGLQMFACAIADIIERFTNASTVIMGDVTYGACCVDDYTAVALGCDMLVHYGHSCLVPIDQTTIKTLYVFVEIGIDSSHLAETIRLNFPNDRWLFQEQLLEYEYDDARVFPGQKIGRTHHLKIEEHPSGSEAEPSAPTERTRFALVSTIQFVAALQKLKEDLTSPYPDAATSPDVMLHCAESELSVGDVSKSSSDHRLWTGVYEAMIPRSKPLSPGEILGCTAPLLGDIDALIYLGDGRFHLESIMIANPSVPAFRYDPYSKKITREFYDHQEMQAIRHDAVQKARQSVMDVSQASDSHAIVFPDQNSMWGIILGTLGRQGSLKQMQAITRQLSTSNTAIPYIPILLSELSPAKLALFDPYISTFIQTSCPRLSIDWGYAFNKPLLNPYETAVAVGRAKGWMSEEACTKAKSARYPMDFYEAGSPWAKARMKSTYS